MRTIAALLMIGLSLGALGKVVHKERSLYQTILVTEVGDLVCLQFNVRRDQKNQSCLNRREPRKMVFTYTRMMMAALLVNPEPRRILMVGLGGGTVSTALAELIQEVHIDIVEIDPAVVSVAERYFDFVASDRVVVHVGDARVFTKRARQRGDRYDLVLLDAYNGDYIPEHLMTREYLLETRDILTAGGTLVANTFTMSRLYDHESTTYRAAFGTFYNLRTLGSANRIILAVNGTLPDRAAIEANAARWRRPLEPYGVPLGRFTNAMSTGIDWNPDARVLTDQYAPANLLRGGE